MATPMYKSVHELTEDIFKYYSLVETAKTAPNRCITRKSHPNGNPNVQIVHELTDV